MENFIRLNGDLLICFIVLVGCILLLLLQVLEEQMHVVGFAVITLFILADLLGIIMEVF